MPFRSRRKFSAPLWIATRLLIAGVCVPPTTIGLALLFAGSGFALPSAASGAFLLAIEISFVESLALCAIVSAYDVILLRRSASRQSELEQLARTDQLTGLLNRRGFDNASLRATRADGALSRPAAALMCDLDFFKSINDRHGHDFGDATLRGVAFLLLEFAQKRNMILGRQGGEEFVALILDISLQEATALALSLREACASRPIVFCGKAVDLTMSIGVAACGAYETTPAALIARADRALYEAKRAGRNRVAVDDPARAAAAA